MKVRQIWSNEIIALYQIYDGNFCVTAVLRNNEIIKASSDWDCITKFIDELL
jgi:hypothetical protein